MMILTAKRRILNLRFLKNIDLNHKSIHHSELLTYAIVIDIVSVTLYHTCSEVAMLWFDESLNQIQKYSESYQNIRLKVLGIISN